MDSDSDVDIDVVGVDVELASESGTDVDLSSDVDIDVVGVDEELASESGTDVDLSSDVDIDVVGVDEELALESGADVDLSSHVNIEPEDPAPGPSRKRRRSSDSVSSHSDYDRNIPIQRSISVESFSFDSSYNEDDWIDQFIVQEDDEMEGNQIICDENGIENAENAENNNEALDDSDGDLNPFLNEFEEDLLQNEIYNNDELPVGWDLPPQIVHDEILQPDLIDNVVRRPNVWAVYNFPHVIREKSALTRYKTLRQSYMHAVVFGEENLEEVSELDFGAPDKICEFCGALYWQAELTVARNAAGWKCCNYGAYMLPRECQWRRPPPHIAGFFSGGGEHAINFQCNVLKYNKLFATAFVAGDFKNVGLIDRGLWSLKVNGEVRWHNHAYRNAGDELTPPNTGQIYFLDFNQDTEDNIIEQRLRGLSFNDDLRRDTLILLERFLRSHNPYIQAFKTAAEVQARERELALQENREMPDIVLVINPKEPGTRVRGVSHDYVQRILGGNRYTVNPTADFVGAIFSGSLPPFTYDAMYFPRQLDEGERPPGAPQVSSVTLDLQMYPLLHLFGEGSWLIKNPNSPNIRAPSIAAYCRYRMGIRRDGDFHSREYNPLFRGKKLFASWLLNSALKVEYDKLNWHLKNQKTLRAHEYKGLQEFVQEQAHRQQRTVGRINVLPRGIYSSPRHMKDLFYDAMAVSQELGQPSYLITLTCNRKWNEIVQECTLSGTDSNFRYDIVNRSFEMRAHQLLSDITNKQMLGRVLGEMTVREFQGRGLTHTHGLFIMHEDDRPTDGADVDRVIWAELPDRDLHPTLFELVCKFMIHGPCDKNSPCHKGRLNCKSGFPFEFRNFTDIVSKKPLYRRRNDGRGFIKKIGTRDVWMNNKWVIPYNPVLLLRYRGHLNIIYCPSTSGVKYLYGYLLKGHYGSKVRVSISRKNADRPAADSYDHDEIQDYKEMRQMGAYEAHYIIQGVGRSHMYPPCDVLPVHLEGQHNVHFEEGEEEAALDRNYSKLSRWFELNHQPGPHRGKLYKDVVKNYLWTSRQVMLNGEIVLVDGVPKKEFYWKPSVRHTIGRLCPVACTSNNEELFHLRMLLCHRTDVTSFADLRTIDGVLCETYKDACRRLNLIVDGAEIETALQEIAFTEFPRLFRRTFALILLNCNPTEPRRLFDLFKVQLAEDYVHNMFPQRNFDELQEDQQQILLMLALRDIREVLEEGGKSLAYYNLPNVNDELLILHPLYEDQHDVITPVVAAARVDTLNEGQRTIFDTVMHAVDEGPGAADQMLFLSGEGGSGKTYFFNVLIDYCEAHNIPIVSAAYTGIAATLIRNCRTSHKTFGFELEDKGAGLNRSKISIESKDAELLKAAKIITWDEVSMASAWQLHVVDLLLRDIMKETDGAHQPPLQDIPFGGKVIILSGDFKQILTIVKGGSRADIVDATLTSSNLWPLFRKHTLLRNMRAARDPDWGAWTVTVGDGSANEFRSERIIMPNDVVVSDCNALMNFVFGRHFNLPDLHRAAILCPKNDAVAAVNDTVVTKLLHGRDDVTTYFASNILHIDATEEEREDAERTHFTEEFLGSLQGSSLPPNVLKLAPGVQVMLIRNLRLNGGLCNGTRLQVERCFPNLILTKIMSGTRAGEQAAIFRTMIGTDEFALPGRLLRKQFPLRLAYAFSINKSQGQTLSRCGLLLKTPAFSHGQLYTAVSRCSSKLDFKTFIERGPLQGVVDMRRGIRNKKFFTQNPVYFEVLRDAVN